MNEQLQNKTKPALFPHDLLSEMDKWVAKYPSTQKQSALLPILLLVQEHHNGWLPQEQLDNVADYLEIPRISVYEVATFYTMYNLQPVGRHQICVCTNVSCMLAGSDQVVTHLKRKLSIELGQTTKDGLFTLKEVECLGACIGAPMMQVDKDYHEHLTEEKIDQILEQLQTDGHGASAGEKA